MATEGNEEQAFGEQEEEVADPGFLGGGGPASTLDTDDVAEGILDEHGENLATVDEDQLGDEDAA